MYKQTAKLWSHVYAAAPISSPDYTRKIDKLCAMGFDKVRNALLYFPFEVKVQMLLPICDRLMHNESLCGSRVCRGMKHVMFLKNLHMLFLFSVFRQLLYQ